jgi:hypothetical protein
MAQEEYSKKRREFQHLSLAEHGLRMKTCFNNKIVFRLFEQAFNDLQMMRVRRFMSAGMLFDLIYVQFGDKRVRPSRASQCGNAPPRP